MVKRLRWLICLWMLNAALQLNAQQQKTPTRTVASDERVGTLNLSTHSFAMMNEATGIPGSAGGRNNSLTQPWRGTTANAAGDETNHSTGNTPTEWLTSVNASAKAQNHQASPADDLAFCGHRIPVVGRLIVGVGQKAESHPRLTRLLEALDPSLDKGPANRQLPRGIHK
jgi:hypothetical protein